MSGELTLEEIRAQQPEVAEMVDNESLSLKDAATLAKIRNHAANYSPRKEWYPNRDKGSGLQRTHDYRPQLDFKAIRKWVLERDQRVCHYCKADATEVDHLWPRRFGGGDHINNLVAACRKCNGSKGAAIDLSSARPDLIKCGLAAIIARLGSEIDELERWSRAYADRLQGSSVVARGGTELFGLAMDIGDPLIELQSIKRSMQAAADRKLTEGRSDQ